MKRIIYLMLLAVITAFLWLWYQVDDGTYFEKDEKEGNKKGE